MSGPSDPSAPSASSAPARHGDLLVRSGAATHVGRIRAHNEDCALAAGTLFVVADGMGGHAAGEIASGLAVAALRELLDRPQVRPTDIVDQLRVANDRILSGTAQHPERSGMGTTVTGLAIVTTGGSDHWAVFNVGDSRTYRLVGDRLTQITVDHSEVRELIDAGLITAADAARHPLRNVITRSLGSDPFPLPDVWVVPPYAGERFLVCSDGLTGELSDEQIRDILLAHPAPQAGADALVAAAVEAGGRDNVTAVVVALDAAAETDDNGDDDTAPRAASPREVFGG